MYVHRHAHTVNDIWLSFLLANLLLSLSLSAMIGMWESMGRDSREEAPVWRCDAKKEVQAMPFDSRAQSDPNPSWLFPTPLSDLYQEDERAAQQMPLSSLPLLSSPLLLAYIWKFDNLKLEKNGQTGDSCISCVIFALL